MSDLSKMYSWNMVARMGEWHRARGGMEEVVYVGAGVKSIVDKYDKYLCGLLEDVLKEFGQSEEASSDDGVEVLDAVRRVKNDLKKGYEFS